MKTLKFIAATAFTLLFCMSANAQFLDRLGKAVQRSAENTTIRKAEQKTESAVSKGIDDATNPSKSKGNDKGDNNSRAAAADVNDSENTAAPSGKSSGKAAPEALESYSQYDFVPGDQILFFEDFSQDAIGDFPALWTTNSSGEVKTLNKFPGKWFQITDGHGVFTYLNTLDLPPNFILEFDYIPYYSEEAQQKNPNRVNWYATAAVKLYHHKDGGKEMDTGLYPGDMGTRLFFSNSGWSMNAYNRDAPDQYGQESRSSKNPIVSEEVNHIIVWVQNRRVRVYHGGAKVLDAPTLMAPNTTLSRIVFLNDHGDNRPFFGNIKITTASPDMRSKLLTEGKIISYGINFDSGKDIIKPESYGAVKAIADVLKENPEVRITIIGHTDSDGNADSNLDLSKRRAAAVKNCLSREFGIDASRMETDGKGQIEPLAPNATSEGKAKNRRVEFIKI